MAPPWYDVVINTLVVTYVCFTPSETVPLEHFLFFFFVQLERGQRTHRQGSVGNLKRGNFAPGTTSAIAFNEDSFGFPKYIVCSVRRVCTPLIKDIIPGWCLRKHEEG